MKRITLLLVLAMFFAVLPGCLLDDLFNDNKDEDAVRYDSTPVPVVVPTVVATHALDLNGNGKVDAIEIEFSVPVNDASIAANLAEFQIKDTGAIEPATGFSTIVTSVAASNTANDQYVRLTFAEATITTTGKPNYEYTAVGAGFFSTSGGQLADIASVAVSHDKAAPVLLAATAGALNGVDGVFDLNQAETFSFVFSEAMAADISLDDLQAGIEADDQGAGTVGTWNEATELMPEYLFFDDLVGDATANIAPSTTTVANDTIKVTADGGNTASTVKIVDGFKFRVVSGQTVIKDANANNAAYVAAGVAAN